MLKQILRNRRVLALISLTVTLIVFSSVAALASSGPVKVNDNFFSPKTITVRRGAKLTWAWAGVKYHNVTVKSGPSSFHSRTQVRGSFSHTFTKAGTYHLYCTIHPNMRMTVVVR